MSTCIYCWMFTSADANELDLDGQGGRKFLRVLLNLVMHNYPQLVTGALQLLFRHFSQRQEVLQAFKQVSTPSEKQWNAKLAHMRLILPKFLCQLRTCADGDLFWHPNDLKVFFVHAADSTPELLITRFRGCFTYAFFTLLVPFILLIQYTWVWQTLLNSLQICYFNVTIQYLIKIFSKVRSKSIGGVSDVNLIRFELIHIVVKLCIIVLRTQFSWKSW